jgi:muramoyltetrapeptide carboxypeptidase
MLHFNQFMSNIYLFSPSGAIRDSKGFKRGVSLLKSLGHSVEIDPNALSAYQRFAGDDQTRLEAIERAAHSGADVAMVTRGGYGLTRLLPRIKYASIKKAIHSGTDFIGFSDFTAFQAAVLAKTGCITWSGPTLMDDLASESPNELTLECLNDFLLSRGEGTGWHLKGKVLKSFLEQSGQKFSHSGFLAKNSLLWGGNLTVLCSLLGTAYFPTIKGGVLFLEDVAEHPYRIERMLDQLMNAGVLAAQKAIVLGQFNRFQLNSHDRGFTLEGVVKRLRQNLKIPVLSDLPFGHVPLKVCLPMGHQVNLYREDSDVLILWNNEHHHHHHHHA